MLRILNLLLLMVFAAPVYANLAYVTNYNGNTVSVIETDTNMVVGTISDTSFNAPVDTAFTPNGMYAYVTNNGSSSTTVSVIDVSSNTVIGTVTVGTGSFGIGITPDGSYAYVANYYSGNVSVIETSNNTIYATIPVGTDPTGVAISPSGSLVYVTNSGSGTVSVIETTSNTVTATITVGTTPFDIAITPDGGVAYITNYGPSGTGNTVSVIDTSTNMVTATVTVGPTPVGVAVTPNGQYAYVANYNSNTGPSTLSVIDTGTNMVIATVPVGGDGAADVSITEDSQYAYVAVRGGDSVSVIETSSNTVVATIGVGSNPFGMTVGQVAQPTNLNGYQMIINFERYNYLSWTASSNVSNYLLYRDGVLIETLSGSADSYVDQDVPAGNFTYELYAENPLGESLPASVTIQGLPAPVPAGFTGVQKFVNFERYNYLSWTENSAAIEYYLYRAGVLIATLSGSADSYVDQDVPAGNFTYQLIALYPLGLSQPATVTIQGLPAPVPAGFRGVQKIVNFERDNFLYWTKNSAAIEYFLYREGILIATLGGSADSYVDKNRPPGDETYQLIALYPLGYSRPATVTIKGISPPAPTGFTGVQKVNNFGTVLERYNVLSWHHYVGAKYYLLYRDGKLIARLDGNVTSYEDHDQPKQKETYTLVAVTALGKSYSASVTVGGK